jgi:hypothetical protein
MIEIHPDAARIYCASHRHTDSSLLMYSLVLAGYTLHEIIKHNHFANLTIGSISMRYYKARRQLKAEGYQV